jgi:hypothetical protein
MKEEPTAKKSPRNTRILGALKRQSPCPAGVHQSNNLENPITRNLCRRSFREKLQLYFYTHLPLSFSLESFFF